MSRSFRRHRILAATGQWWEPSAAGPPLGARGCGLDATQIIGVTVLPTASTIQPVYVEPVTIGRKTQVITVGDD
jgi:hypothetical protein